VDGLEKDDFVRRVPSLTDRRTIYVELTDKGQSLAELILPAMARFMAQLMHDFSDTEKRTLSGLLDRLRRNAESFDSKTIE
jgi:DNA-binding MarR family transcriptional regulator